MEKDKKRVRVIDLEDSPLMFHHYGDGIIGYREANKIECPICEIIKNNKEKK